MKFVVFACIIVNCCIGSYIPTRYRHVFGTMTEMPSIAIINYTLTHQTNIEQQGDELLVAISKQYKTENFKRKYKHGLIKSGWYEIMGDITVSNSWKLVSDINPLDVVIMMITSDTLNIPPTLVGKSRVRVICYEWKITQSQWVINPYYVSKMIGPLFGHARDGDGQNQAGNRSLGVFEHGALDAVPESDGDVRSVQRPRNEQEFIGNQNIIVGGILLFGVFLCIGYVIWYLYRYDNGKGQVEFADPEVIQERFVASPNGGVVQTVKDGEGAITKTKTSDVVLAFDGNTVNA